MPQSAMFNARELVISHGRIVFCRIVLQMPFFKTFFQDEFLNDPRVSGNTARRTFVISYSSLVWKYKNIGIGRH